MFWGSMRVMRDLLRRDSRVQGEAIRLISSRALDFGRAYFYTLRLRCSQGAVVLIDGFMHWV